MMLLMRFHMGLFQKLLHQETSCQKNSFINKDKDYVKSSINSIFILIVSYLKLYHLILFMGDEVCTLF
ncbi:hypothetical protein TPHV1_220041 [Treponema phagedenis]|uniref:Uncharacterized protein n=1 Tax=Treponema phagedenis TaxID=162 RepID=A0A0B7GWH6_TREPH|nr:hypothetical protein TPHV1_220041 [Treponema phagedenis]